MRTLMRTQTPITRYGVHRSITSRNPRIGLLTHVSQLEFLDPPGMTTRPQFIYLHIFVPLGHPLVIPLRDSARYLFVFSLVWFILGWLYPYLYVLLTHSLLEPDGGERQTRWGKEVNKTG